MHTFFLEKLSIDKCNSLPFRNRMKPKPLSSSVSPKAQLSIVAVEATTEKRMWLRPRKQLRNNLVLFTSGLLNNISVSSCEIWDHRRVSEERYGNESAPWGKKFSELVTMTVSRALHKMGDYLKTSWKAGLYQQLFLKTILVPKKLYKILSNPAKNMTKI